MNLLFLSHSDWIMVEIHGYFAFLLDVAHLRGVPHLGRMLVSMRFATLTSE